MVFLLFSNFVRVGVTLCFMRLSKIWLYPGCVQVELSKSCRCLISSETYL